MDYYEELGVPRTATPDQIRQAYKGLVRLLHPDQFQDPGLRQLAESQMKRINEIFALLSDPAQRGRYDEPPAPLPLVARYREHAGWSVAVVVALAWIVTSLVSSPVPLAKSVPAPLPQPAVEDHPTPRPMARPAPRTRFRDSSVPPSAAVETVDVPIPPAVEAPPPVVAAVETPAVALVHPQPPPPRPKGLSGRWLYLHPALAPPSKELYLPEYIEAAIFEESGGTLRGRYRARYRVTDRAISPEVEFQFEGAASGTSVSLPWSGGGGSRGKVQLRQVSPDSLEVTWFATELGKNLGLGSGTAVLVRRQEP
jgi:hypothetical protein